MPYYDPPADLTTHGAVLRIDQKLPELVDGKLPVDVTGIVVEIGSSIEISNDVGNPIPIDDAGGSITVDATSLPLPTGASTEAKQDTLIGHVDGLEGLLTSLDGKAPALVDGKVPVDIGASLDGNVTVINDNASPVPISDAGGSITVDGPLTDTQLRATAVPVSLTSAPLPTGAATAANQSTLIGHVDGLEGLLTTIDADTSALAGAVSGTELQVDIVSAPTLTVSDGGGSLTVDGTVAISGTVPVSAASLPLPTGAATSALQTTSNSSLSSIDGKLPALSSGRVPVVQSLLFTPTTTSVASSATSVLLLASNANRKGLFVSNLSNGILYISFSNPATTANCFTAVYPGGTLSLDTTMFSNALYGIWSSANGTAQITEFV